jgi:predicted acylesterase/phospholipase RssA
MIRTALGLALSAALVSACATAPRLDSPLASPRGAAPVGFPTSIRTETTDTDFLKENAVVRQQALAKASDRTVDLLALSGGGAGGAFGAGVLIGLTEAGTRPRFEMVTGVSTGALIAPFAFLGSDWDDELRKAYQGEATGNLMQSRGVGALWDVGMFDGKPLRDLVARFVTDELVTAVAKEAAGGRMLIVATTNLDREETVVWDMGAIAMAGGDKARDLFRNVLVASASVPGVFPPVMIEVEKDGKIYQEMHVDGGASTPFFVAPEAIREIDAISNSPRGANIYVIINGQSASAPRTTSNNTLDIAARSFTSVLNHLTRSAISQTADFARDSRMSFRFTAIPSDVQFGGSLAFETPNMRDTFNYGARCAASGLVWVTQEQAAARGANEEAELKPFAAAGCPLLAPGRPS